MGVHGLTIRAYVNFGLISLGLRTSPPASPYHFGKIFLAKKNSYSYTLKTDSDSIFFFFFKEKGHFIKMPCASSVPSRYLSVHEPPK